MSNFIDEMMDFDPSNYSVFNNAEGAQNPVSSIIYKTQPKNAKSEDGNYRATIRVINNPFDVPNSIAKTTIYSMSDANGWFTAPSALSIGDRNCPIFKAWKELWFSGDEKKKAFAKEKYSKREEQWVTVQIIDDPNFPELNGQIKIMKLPTAIWKKMDAKMNPAAETKKAPQPIMDWLIGNILNIDVQPGPDDPAHPERKQREVSYELCDFEPYTKAITKTDGSELFTDEELDVIEEWAIAKTDYLKGKYSGKPDKKAEKAAQKIVEIKEQVKELYQKALDYLKSVAPNVSVEKGYKSWDAELTTRVNNWIDATRLEANGGVLVSAPSTDAAPKTAPSAKSATAPVVETPTASIPDDVEDGLPF